MSFLSKESFSKTLSSISSTRIKSHFYISTSFSNLINAGDTGLVTTDPIITKSILHAVFHPIKDTPSPVRYAIIILYPEKEKYSAN